MPEINGPIVKKTVHVPAHDEEHIDDDAYWHLNWQGDLDDDGTFLYAKVAWPTVREAQQQHHMRAAAREAERQEGRKRTKHLQRVRKLH